MKDKRLFTIILCGLLRMSVFGFYYYPLLDDYIQLDCYPNMPGIYVKLGLWRQRPLAAIFDIYVWSINKNASFFAITLMHCLSAYFLIKIFEACGMKPGLLFAVCYMLCPLNIEASYWISASGRIIVPVFLASCAVLCMLKNKMLPFYLLFVISLLFYEQCAVFSFMLAASAALCTKRGKLLYPLFLTGCLYVSYYLAFAGGGSFGERMSFGFTPQCIKTFSKMLTLWNWLEIPGAAFFAAVLLCSALCLTDSGKPSAKGVIIGVIYAIGGILPFIFLKNPTIGFRSLFIPLIGLSLAFDSIFGQRIRRILTPVLTAVFILSSAADLNAYRINYYADMKIIKSTAAGASAERLPPRNIRTRKDFAQFILGAGFSDWALTGAVRAYTGKYDMPYIKIIPDSDC